MNLGDTPIDGRIGVRPASAARRVNGADGTPGSLDGTGDRDGVLATRQWIEEHAAGMRADLQQRLIDMQVRETRRRLVRALRRGGAMETVAFLDEDFLAVADQPAIMDAILDAAMTAGAADACDLQLYDGATGSLRMEALRGFTDEFAGYFATVDPAESTACARALRMRTAVHVDDVTSSPIFADSAALEQILAAGTRAVRSYPLLTSGCKVFGVLSLHYHRTAPADGLPDQVAEGAVQALRRARPSGHALTSSRNMTSAGTLDTARR